MSHTDSVTEVILTDEALDWFEVLSRKDREAIAYLIDMLEIAGVGLGYPYASQIKGSKYALRELRKKGRPPLRALYIFDNERQAVVLVRGDKSGDPKFYDRMIPAAERVWEQYKRERAVERRGK